MAMIQNIPGIVKFLGTIRRVNPLHLDIDRARESGDPKAERQAIASALSQWSKDAADTMKLHVEVEGTENIPDGGFLVVANHQSYADILAVLRALDGHQCGFIAKDNLQKVPRVGYWIPETRGLFIHRGDPKAAIRTIQEGAALLKEGFSLCIFPEGTRSWGPVPNAFKAGSFKLATKAKVPVLPIAINGTYHFYEETKRLRPANVTVKILPAVPLGTLPRQEQGAAEKEIYRQICEAVAAMDANDPLSPSKPAAALVAPEAAEDASVESMPKAPAEPTAEAPVETVTEAASETSAEE